jgi:hypothetical protein
MPALNVLKLNLEGVEVWRYPAKVLAEAPGQVTIEAFFNRADLHFHDILFGQGDRFVETYYTERWYNIYEIHAREDGHVRGWYCNISRPAFVSEQTISYVDLALDLLVYPDGRQLVLDEDEFAALPLSAGERIRAREALVELQTGFTRHIYPPRLLPAAE